MILFAFVISQSQVLTVNKIDLKLNNTPCVNLEQLKTTLNLKGKNILFLDNAKIKKALLAEYPCVGDIKLERFFLGAIKIEIEGRTAFVKIASFSSAPPLTLKDLEATSSTSTALLDGFFPSSTEENFILDEAGVIFAKNSSNNLPILFWPDKDLKIGQSLDKSLVYKVSKIITKLTQLEINKSENPVRMKLKDEDFIIQALPKLVFSLSKDIPKQLASLQLILAKAKIDEKTIESLDLRFDKPVIIYGQR